MWEVDRFNLIKSSLELLVILNCQNPDKLNKVEQKQFSQKKMNLRRLFKLFSIKIYTKKNLDDFETLNRALRLFFVVRFDQVNQHICINSHVEYDKISRLILNIIHVKMKK